MQLFQWTGNPFTDTGISAIVAHSDRRSPEEITVDDAQKLSQTLLTLYLTPEWLKAMQNIFPNGALTNGAFAKNRAPVWEAVLDFLVGELKPAGNQGNCTSCGRRDAIRLDPGDKRKLPNNMVFNKVYVPLVGGVPNFFAGGTVGIDLCANCALAIQCAPLNFYTANCDEKRFLVVHSNSSRTMRLYAEHAAKAIRTQLTTGQFAGPFSNGYRNAHNAFFHLVELVLADHVFAEEDKHTTVTLYHFDNYNQPKLKPLHIYSMPAPVFCFLAGVKNSSLWLEWRRLFGQNYYFLKGGQKVPMGLREEQIEEQKYTRNLIFENLLNGVSIAGRFYSKRKRVTFASWKLLALYLTEVRFMNKERLETIKRVGDELAAIIRADREKRLTALERASSYTSFRNVLRLCVKDRLRVKAEGPLFTFDEYADELFPDGALNWRETQDLLLFRIYETLHEWLRDKDIPEDDPAETEEPLKIAEVVS